jgi:hypothetical protein
MGLSFRMFCDVTVTGPYTNIAQGFVYSFTDCIEWCAGYNFWSGSAECTWAALRPDGGPPGNCWIGSGKLVAVGTGSGVDRAFLKWP